MSDVACRVIGPPNAAGVFEGVRSEAIAVHQFRCTQVRNRNANCMRCAGACTSGCISLVDGSLHVDADKCVGCGTCATVCPTCALESLNPTDAQLLRDTLASREGDRVTIACRPLIESIGPFMRASACSEVVCLGRVDESLLVQLAERRVNRIELACGACDSCEQKQGLSCARTVVSNVRSLCEAWGIDLDVRVVEGVRPDLLADPKAQLRAERSYAEHFSAGASNPPLAQRVDKARFARTDCRIPEDSSVLKVMKDGTLPHFLPQRREKLLTALALAGSEPEGTIETGLWGCVVIDGAKCSSCRMCATFCPTGALEKFDGEDGSFGVLHFPGSCVNCESCKSICPDQAITILPHTRAAYILEGSVHRYAMRQRAVALNDEHQILNTMKLAIDGDVFER